MYKTTFNISWQCYNNTVYIIDERSQYLYSFSGVGKIFWDAVLSNLSYPSICKKVLENYTNSTPEEIKNDFCDMDAIKKAKMKFTHYSNC